MLVLSSSNVPELSMCDCPVCTELAHCWEQEKDGYTNRQLEIFILAQESLTISYQKSMQSTCSVDFYKSRTW